MPENRTLTFRLDDKAPENVPDRSQMKAYITELDHLVKVHRLKRSCRLASS